ncbi:hypothetical protein EJB05_35186, partial [Eragrostis curvula]
PNSKKEGASLFLPDDRAALLLPDDLAPLSSSLPGDRAEDRCRAAPPPSPTTAAAPLLLPPRRPRRSRFFSSVPDDCRSAAPPPSPTTAPTPLLLLPLRRPQPALAVRELEHAHLLLLLPCIQQPFDPVFGDLIGRFENVSLSVSLFLFAFNKRIVPGLCISGSIMLMESTEVPETRHKEVSIPGFLEVGPPIREVSISTSQQLSEPIQYNSVM